MSPRGTDGQLGQPYGREHCLKHDVPGSPARLAPGGADRRGLVRQIALLVLIGLCPAAAAAEGAALPPPGLDLAFSRYYPGTVALADGPTTLVLRMDRDIAALKLEV